MDPRTRRSSNLLLRLGLPLLAAFLLFAVAPALSDDIAGCGGFVRLSKELQSKGGKSKLPYESVYVELVSADGDLVKERAECAPNGYYFLPIYDKGSFNMRVHGPKGWNFEPNSVLIEDGRCDSSRDYNFVVTGFVLSGTVRSLGQESSEAGKGPAGVTITLKNKLNPKAAERTTSTGSDGAFRFDNVFPGAYEVVASHPSWTFTKDRAEVSFEWDNVEVKEQLLVGGFEVSGAVQSVEENAPVSGVEFILYSASGLQGLPVACTTDGVSDAPKGEKGMKAVCGARSDAAGRFVIKGVPCGKYTLVPRYRSSNTNYDLLPASIDITVSHANLEVSEPFRVAGFSVEGRVVDTDGQGVAGATVLFDGVEKATTDADGRYRVEKVRVGSYAVEVVKDHVFFESLKNVQLSPSKAQVPQIKAASYHLCGRVSLSPGHAEERRSSSGHRDVLLVDLASGREERRSTDPAGAYCFEVAPGRYRVSPVVSAAEERAGLLFVPAKREVTLSKSPALDVNFGQALVTVQGVVRCLEAPCDPSISITLTGIDIDSRATASLSPSEKQEATYAIRDVLPGQYEVQIKHESWCWKQSSFKLDVKAEAETGNSHVMAPEFVHEGYMLSSVVSHDVKLVASLDSSPKHSQTFDLTKGTNRFCLSKPGIYTLAPVSCYKFERDSYKYDTANPRLLDLQATHFLLNASVLASQPASDITIHVTVDHAQKAGKDAAHEEYHTDMRSGGKREEGGQHKYDFSIWVAPGEKLSLTPKAPAGSDLLFYPPTATFTLNKAECPAPLQPFQARPGSYAKGRVEPALANVRVRVYATGEGEDRRLVAESTTTANGTYSIGPLPDNTPYEIEAVQEGYYFRQTETGVFQAQKLGTVAVTVRDESGNPLPGVVISLSGEGYRSNNPTNPQGVFAISALHPGSYYLRPLLKEYVFQPSATSVEVKEGQDERVTISAKRVAYSCFGKIRSLSGEAEKFVPVEAVSTTGEVEETQTDAEGSYRLRGLQPGKEYRIRVKTSDQRIERASPADGYLVHLPEKAELKDVQNKDFIVFRRLPKLDLTGEVAAEPHVLSTLKVEVFEDGKPEVVKTVNMGPSAFFNAGPLGREAKYLVRVSSSLSPRSYSHAPQEVSVVLNAATHLKLNFTATAHDPLRHDLTSTPIFSFILAVILVALVYYHKLALAVGKAALAGDIKGVKSLLRGNVEEEEDSATSFLSHLQQPSKAGRAGARKNVSRPGNNRPQRS